MRRNKTFCRLLSSKRLKLSPRDRLSRKLSVSPNSRSSRSTGSTSRGIWPRVRIKSFSTKRGTLLTKQLKSYASLREWLLPTPTSRQKT